MGEMTSVSINSESLSKIINNTYNSIIIFEGLCTMLPKPNLESFSYSRKFKCPKASVHRGQRN